ncbi:hypothetical protein NC651_039180 [Populus alba x Populus x berolinensis]|nr:hypothetical protein NC651_039180 [Populus alba x Populus x berolinensis]
MCDTREEVDVDEVKLNTVLAVKAGEVIPIHRGSFPVTKQGDSVVTTALAEDCVAAKMAKLVEEARNSKSKTRRFIDKFAQYYTSVSACPCALILSTPIATFCALTRAATAGLLIKGRFSNISAMISAYTHCFIGKD